MFDVGLLEGVKLRRCEVEKVALRRSVSVNLAELWRVAGIKAHGLER